MYMQRDCVWKSIPVLFLSGFKLHRIRTGFSESVRNLRNMMHICDKIHRLRL